MPSPTEAIAAAAPTLSDIYDAGLIDTLKDIFVKVTELYTVFPVNIFMTLTIIGFAIALIRKAVNSFRASN